VNGKTSDEQDLSKRGWAEGGSLGGRTGGAEVKTVHGEEKRA